MSKITPVVVSVIKPEYIKERIDSGGSSEISCRMGNVHVVHVNLPVAVSTARNNF